jgi:hypothetical protein
MVLTGLAFRASRRRKFSESFKVLFFLPGGISELEADASRHRVDDRMFEIDEMWMPCEQP